MTLTEYLHYLRLESMMLGDDLPPLPEKPAWMADALCREFPEVDFFPPRGGTTKPAKAICARCPVIDECADYSFEAPERYGVWGGMSERERRPAQRQRPAA